MCFYYKIYSTSAGQIWQHSVTEFKERVLYSEASPNKPPVNGSLWGCYLH